MKKSKKRLKWFGVGAGLLVLVLAVFVFEQAQTRRIAETSHYMDEVMTGIEAYEKTFGQLPRSLAEVVQAGLLPRESIIYSCPLLREDKPPVLRFDEAEFLFSFGEVATMETPPQLKRISITRYSISPPPSRKPVER